MALKKCVTFLLHTKIVIKTDQENRDSDVSVSSMAILEQLSSKPRGYNQEYQELLTK